MLRSYPCTHIRAQRKETIKMFWAKKKSSRIAHTQEKMYDDVSCDLPHTTKMNRDYFLSQTWILKQSRNKSNPPIIDFSIHKQFRDNIFFHNIKNNFSVFCTETSFPVLKKNVIYMIIKQITHFSKTKKIISVHFVRNFSFSFFNSF